MTFLLGLIFGIVSTAYVGSLYLVWRGEEAWRVRHRSFWTWLWNGK